jgi:hypothetical protein
MCECTTAATAARGTCKGVPLLCLVTEYIIRWRRDRSVDRCSMTRDAPTAAGGCLTDRTTIPALPMPYAQRRQSLFCVTHVLPGRGGRDAFAKWHLRSSSSSDGIRKEMTRKGCFSFRDTDWTRGNILCHAGLQARFNHVPIVFTGIAATRN